MTIRERWRRWWTGVFYKNGEDLERLSGDNKLRLAQGTEKDGLVALRTELRCKRMDFYCH